MSISSIRSSGFLAAVVGLGMVAVPAIAQNSMSPTNGQRNQWSSSAGDAAQRVPAQAVLSGTLDARKLQTGASFQAELNHKVHLKNGTELPSGTVLRGTVAADDMNVSGNSKLVLRFNTAQLKDGQTLPIRATIVGLQSPGNEEYVATAGFAEPRPNDWTPSTRTVDQIGVTSGVDLHSSIASRNSGVFVTTSKDDVKLAKGSTVDLAIATTSAMPQQAGE